MGHNAMTSTADGLAAEQERIEAEIQQVATTIQSLQRRGLMLIGRLEYVKELRASLTEDGA